MATIGFIGLGNMGAPMAANLLKAGHQVTAYDIVPAPVAALAAKGARAAASAAEAIAAGEVVITMLPAGPQVREVYLGNGGVLGRAAKDALLIDCSTIDVETARAVAAAAAEAGFDMLDAPVSGGTAGAAGGEPDDHGRRQRRGLCPRPADPGGDGAHDRPCRPLRQRPGGQDLQQHAARRLDDRRVRGLHAGRQARALGADPVRRLQQILQPMLGVDRAIARCRGRCRPRRPTATMRRALPRR